MMRLLWKEWREQIWFFLAALAAPLAAALYMRLFVSGAWTLENTGFLLPCGVLILWGARLMPMERERGRFTLGMLPVSGASVWLAKLLPAAVTAYYVAVLTCSLHSPWKQPSMPFAWTAGLMELALATGFTLGLVASTPVAVLLGAVAMVFMALGREEILSWPLSHWPIAGRMANAYLMWAQAGILLLAALALMAVRSGLRSPAHARWPIAAVMLLLLLPGIYSAQDGSWNFVYDDQRIGMEPAAVVSAQTGWAAVGVQPWMFVRKEPVARVWAVRLDGTGRRLVTERDRWVTLIGWTGTGELLYSRRDDSGDDHWMAWSPKDGTRREVWRDTADRIPLEQVYVAEPGGTRVACFRRPATRLATTADDVWVVDVASGASRLVAPWEWADTLLWRGRRIYMRSQKTLRSVSPDGGPVRPETRLPVEDVMNAARRGDPAGRPYTVADREGGR